MRKIQISVLIMILLGLSVPAFAQMNGAQNQVSDIVPAGPWLVKDTQIGALRGIKNLKLPCVAIARFGNDFTLRLSGGGHQIQAMAIDFRQDVFRRGARYSANISTDNGFRISAKGSAFSSAVLIFNMRDFNGLYGALQTARALNFVIGDNHLRFSLQGVKDGLARLESCYAGNGTDPIPITGSVMRAPEFMPPAPPGDFEESPLPFHTPEEVVKERGENTPMDTYISRAESHRMANTSTEEYWYARSGESIKDVLSGWANKAGVTLDWKASQTGLIAQDFSYQGDFKGAVAALLAENAAATGLNSQFTSEAAAKLRQRVSSSLVVDPSPHFPPQGRVSVGGRAGVSVQGLYFAAARGMSLQTVLQQWCARQGVEFLWYGDRTFAVKQDVSTQGHFETALQSLLGQFQNDSVRPAARLNRDPETGKKVLMVSTDRL